VKIRCPNHPLARKSGLFLFAISDFSGLDTNDGTKHSHAISCGSTEVLMRQERAGRSDPPTSLCRFSTATVFLGFRLIVLAAVFSLLHLKYFYY
jgi:hypothetical protein